MRVVAGGFEGTNLEGKPHIHIFELGGNGFELPHADIFVVSNTGRSLEDEAKKNFDANVNHPGIPAQVVKAIHKGVFNGKKYYMLVWADTQEFTQILSTFKFLDWF